MKKIQYVSGLHGNESIPTIALASLNYSQIVANPPALVAGKRFIDMDMNKAFGTSGNTSEENLAKRALKQIEPSANVIDFHTCSAKTEPFAIITRLEMLSFAQTLGLDHVVYMKHSIKSGHALIDYCQGVSVEAGVHKTQEAFEQTLSIVTNAQKGIKKEIKIYEVFGIIDKPGKYINFVPYKNEFIPILAGEKAYDFYGLKAKLVDKNSLQ